MSPVAEAAIITGINALFELWRIHANKPPEWKPTKEDWDNFISKVIAATPEAEKAAARARLNLPPDIEPLPQEPQAPV